MGNLVIDGFSFVNLFLLNEQLFIADTITTVDMQLNGGRSQT